MGEDPEVTLKHFGRKCGGELTSQPNGQGREKDAAHAGEEKYHNHASRTSPNQFFAVGHHTPRDDERFGSHHKEVAPRRDDGCHAQRAALWDRLHALGDRRRGAFRGAGSVPEMTKREEGLESMQITRTAVEAQFQTQKAISGPSALDRATP